MDSSYVLPKPHDSTVPSLRKNSSLFSMLTRGSFVRSHHSERKRDSESSTGQSAVRGTSGDSSAYAANEGEEPQAASDVRRSEPQESMGLCLSVSSFDGHVFLCSLAV